MPRIARLLALSLAFAAAGASAQSRPAAKPAAPARACVPDEPSFWKDQGLTTKVATRLQFHKPLLREKVEVKVSGNVAMLSGNLSSQNLIQEAVRTASAVGGIKCVQNHLQVGPPLPSTQQPQ